MFGVLTSARILISAVQAIGLILLARFMEPAEFGVFSAIFALQSMLITVTEFGLTKSVMRHYVEGDLGSVRRTLWLNNLLSLAAIMLCSVVALVFVGVSASLALYLTLAVAMSIEKNSEMLVSVEVARGEVRETVGGLFLRALVFAVFFLASIWWLNALLCYVCARLLGAVLSAIWYRHFKAPISEPPVSTREVLRDVRGIGGTAVIGSIYAFDPAILTWTSGSVTAGIYSAANKLVSPLNLVAAPLASVLMPTTTTMSLHDTRQVAKKLLYGMAGLVAVAGLMVPFSTWAMAFVFGATYTPGGLVLALLIVGLPATVINPLLESVLQARHEDRYVFFVSALVSILGRVGLVGASLQAGAVGAAAIVTCFVWLSVAFLFVRLWVVTRGNDPAAGPEKRL